MRLLSVTQHLAIIALRLHTCLHAQRTHRMMLHPVKAADMRCVVSCLFCFFPPGVTVLCAAATGEYTVTWTIKNGGWPRYIHTNIAGMYRQVSGRHWGSGTRHPCPMLPFAPLPTAYKPPATPPSGNLPTT